MSDELRCPDCGGYRGLPRMLHDNDVPQECANAFHKEPAPAVVAEPEPEPSPETSQPPAQRRPNLTLLPVCPYCGAEGLIAAKQTQFGPIAVLVIRCGNDECRKILSVFQPLSLDPVQFTPPSGPTN